MDSLSNINPAQEPVYDPIVLVVDDDVSISTMVIGFLETQGFRSAVCKSGAETLAYLENNRVDLVLLDVRMPDMGGIEVAKRIREDNDNVIGFIPIIMVSAMDSEEDKVKQAGNLAKFDARIREDFRKALNMLTLGLAFKEKGSFGNIYGVNIL